MFDKLVQFVQDFVSYLRETVETFVDDMAANLDSEEEGIGVDEASTRRLVWRIIQEIVLPSVIVAAVRVLVSYTRLPGLPAYMFARTT